MGITSKRRYARFVFGIALFIPCFFCYNIFIIWYTNLHHLALISLKLKIGKNSAEMGISMNLFDILGPVMVGPSSSHTAGAVRIGYIAKILLKDRPVGVRITLHGSFATTGTGHGTDRALIAGILGMKPDDIRIPDSFELAAKQGLSFSFQTASLKGAHPNTAVLELTGEKGRQLTLQASSIGGGRIMVNRLDGIDVNFTGDKPTLIVHNIDQPGHVCEVTSMLSEHSINIATLQLYRDKRGGTAVMVIEVDQPVPLASVAWLEGLEGIRKVIYVNTEGE